MLNGRFQQRQNILQKNDKTSKRFFLLDVVEIPRGITSICKSLLDFDVAFCILI